MAQLSVPSAPREYATHYEMLLGVDFQADQTQVDRRRSPDMVNMISDFGGNPVKRDGFRKVGDAYDALLMVDGKMWGVSSTALAFGIDELELDGFEFVKQASYTEPKGFGDVGTAFVFQKKIYVIASKAMVCFDTETHEFTYEGIGANMMSSGSVGSSAPHSKSADNIPLTIYAMKPDGTNSKAYEDKNLLSIYQKVQYIADGTATYTIPIYSKVGNWFKAEVKDGNGNWTDVTSHAHFVGSATTVTGKTLDGTGWDVTFSVVDPKITFDNGYIPQVPTSYGLPNEDNVRITFAPFSMEVLEAGSPDKYKGYYNEALVNLLSTPAATFQNSRMFVSDKYKVYYSNVSKPFTVSDLAWFDVDNEIVAFTKSNNYLAILTKDDGGNTIFLASEATRVVDSQTGETETYFTCKASNAGIGAIAPKCVATLCDEPMFLARTGVFGLLSNWQSEKYAVNRSSRINRKLCKEVGLENAVGAAFNDYLYVAINGRMYVLDGRHKETDRAGNKPLEAYFFEGLPQVKNIYIANDKMYFADNEATYTWNDDLTDTERYYDYAYIKTVTEVLYQIGDSQYEPPTGEWDAVEPTPAEGEWLWYKATYDDLSVEIGIYEVAVDDTKVTGEAVYSKWSSVYDDDGAPQKLKTLMKKGTMVTLVPHYRSRCKVTLVKDGDVFVSLQEFKAGMQTFEYIDFTLVTFSSNAVAFDNFTKKKIKKYKRLQIQLENEYPEPFGLTQITKTYTFGNYAKR